MLALSTAHRGCTSGWSRVHCNSKSFRVKNTLKHPCLAGIMPKPQPCWLRPLDSTLCVSHLHQGGVLGMPPLYCLDRDAEGKTCCAWSFLFLFLILFKLLLETGLGEMGFSDLPMAVLWPYHHWLFMSLFYIIISKIILFYSVSTFWVFGENMHVLSEVTGWFSFSVTWK